MTTKTISAIARKAFLRRPWRNAKIGAPNPFALFTAKKYNTVAKLPFNKQGAAIAKAYAAQSPAALAALKATAKKNADARRKIRAAVPKGATGLGLFARENKDLYARLGFNGFSRAVAKKWTALSASQKATYTKKAAARNEVVKRYIQANI